MDEKKLNAEETEQAVNTSGEALDEMKTADGIIGEAATVEELAPNDELTDEEAESVDGGRTPLRTHSPRITPTGREIITRPPPKFG